MTKNSDSKLQIISKIDPPEHNFYSKMVDFKGIAIKASQEVDDQALFEAWQRLHMMLKAIPQVTENLKSIRAEVHIIGKNQVTSDLPENRRFKDIAVDGELDIDERTRGTGGLQASCGEENLLRLEKDRYRGRDILVHEFSHTIHTYGLDNSARKKIHNLYESARNKNLWPGCYAISTVYEYFAELAMWYFGTHGDPGNISPPMVAGPLWLKSYDSDAFTFFDQLFTGKMKTKTLTFKPLKQSSLSEEQLKSKNSDTSTMVKFENKTSQPVKLFWLDFQGKRVFYNQLEASHSTFQQTYKTHPWVVTDLNDHLITIFLPQEFAGIARIE